MPRLVFDIETIGEDFESYDEVTQNALTRWIDRATKTDEEKKATLKDLKDGLGFSPLTGAIAAIGVLDVDKNKGVVYFQAPDAGLSETVENGVTFKPMNEKEMLHNFWEGVRGYDEFISFNGRGFDVPFLLVRSAVNEVRATKDLMFNRYVQYQPKGAKHIDLLDQFTFYGAMRRKGSLHLWCRAFGIESPKADGVTGDDVKRLFAEKKYLDIARYNVRDLRSTKALYERWDTHIRFSR